MDRDFRRHCSPPMFGRSVAVTRERRLVGEVEDGALGFLAVHPSFLVRLPERPAVKV